MLELLLQQAGSSQQPSSESRYSFSSAYAAEELAAAFVGCSRAVVDAAAPEGRAVAAAAEATAVKAEEKEEMSGEISEAAAAGAAFISDPEFDLFFDTLHELPALPSVAQHCYADCDVDIGVGVGDCFETVGDDAGLDLLPGFSLLDAAASPAGMLGDVVDSLDGLLDDHDDQSPVGQHVVEEESSSSPTADSSSSPASFEAASLSMSPESPTSPASPSPSSFSSSSSSVKKAGGGGRVSKKEANREAAYRYRLKQRLGDSALQQRCAELQSAGDKLAGRLAGAEREAQFLMQMCRQIFSSRKQFALAQQARD